MLYCMESLGRSYVEEDEILEKLEQKIDYTNVNKWIQSERQKSIDYLKNSIES